MATETELVNAETAVKNHLPTAYVIGKMSGSVGMWQHVFTSDNPCEHGHGKTVEDAWRCTADRMGLKYKPDLTAEDFVKSLYPEAYVESDSNGVSIRVRNETEPLRHLTYYGRGGSEHLAWQNLARKLGWKG